MVINMQTIEMEFKNQRSYDEKVDIQIRLKQNLSSEDYKTVTDAAQTILKTTEKYISQPVSQEKK